MPIIVSMKPYWNVEVGGVACESSSLSVADTANVGVAWEASSTEYCRCYSSKRGNVHEIFFIFFITTFHRLSLLLVTKTMKMHTGPYGARTVGL